MYIDHFTTMTGQTASLCRLLSLAIALFMNVCSAVSQSQSGKIINGVAVYPDSLKAKRAIILVREKDSLRVLAFALTDSNGRYTVALQVLPDKQYTLTANAGKFSSSEILLQWSPKNTDTIEVNFALEQSATALQNVTVKSQVHLSIKGDTIEYKASSYRNLETRKLADMLRQMEGFTVSQGGQLMFQGKRVSAMLIEGEDLAGSRYDLLTKNLSAKIIDKVQVVENYQRNRLLKGVESTDEVAVNLTINATSKGRVSGDFTSGGGTDHRWLLDASGVLLKGVVKAVILGNVNNISQDPLGNLSGQIGSESTAGLARADPNTFMDASIIAPPFELPRYTSDERNSGTAVALSTRLHSIRLRALTGLQDSRLSRSVSTFGEFVLPDGQGWSLTTNEQSVIRNSLAFARLEAERDSGGKSAQYLTFEMQIVRPKTEFGEITMGSIIDYRNEMAFSGRRTLHFSFQNTWSEGPSRVWILKGQASMRNRDQSFLLQTSRLNAYFGLQQGVHHYQQQMMQTNSDVRLNLYRSVRRGKYQSRSGLNLNWGSQEVDDSISKTIFIPPYILKKGIAHSLVGEVNLFYSSVITVSEKVEAGFSVLGRLQRAKIETSRAGRPGYAVSISVNWKLARQTRLSFSALSKLELPAIPEYYGATFLTGGVMIVNGLQRIANRSTQAATLNFIQANLFKARSVVIAASWQRIGNDNTPHEVVRPDFIQLYHLPGAETDMLMFNSSLERYVSGLKAKVGLQVNSMLLNRRYFFNLEPAASDFWNNGVEIKYLTRFSRLNLDVRARRDFFTSRLEQQNHSAIHSSFSQVSFFPGFRYVLKDGFSAVTELGFRRMGQENWFTSLDLSVYFRMGNRLTASVKGHNLGGQEMIASTYISAFSKTASYFQVVPRYVILKISCDF